MIKKEYYYDICYKHHKMASLYVEFLYLTLNLVFCYAALLPFRIHR